MNNDVIMKMLNRMAGDIFFMRHAIRALKSTPMRDIPDRMLDIDDMAEHLFCSANDAKVVIEKYYKYQPSTKDETEK